MKLKIRLTNIFPGFSYGKCKGKFPLEQAMNVQKGNKSITLFVH
jgi:hypothetical protein